MAAAKRRQRAEGPFNVILVSFDTLRRDHLHVYGHPKQLSPALDKLAADGVLFEDAVVNAGWTLPQHVTLHTGAHPLRHGVHFLGKGKTDFNVGRYDRLIPSRLPMLAEVFRENGYLTFGFGNQNAYGCGWKFGFYRGMLHYTTVFPFNNMMEQAWEHIAACVRLAGSRPFSRIIHQTERFS